MSAQERRKKVKLLQKQPGALVVCVCRRGNDSLVATRLLRDAGIPALNLQHGLQRLLTWRDGHALT